MKNKRLIILLILLVVAIAIFFYDKYEDKILPIKLNAEKIDEIEILSNYWDEKIEATLILESEEDYEVIKEIATLFNQSIKHQNQGVGTTHTTQVRIKYNNGNEISFGCGVGNFITVARNSKQYNYINGELDEYIAKLLNKQSEHKTGEIDETIIFEPIKTVGTQELQTHSNDNIKSGSFSEIVGLDFMENISNIEVIDVKEGVLLDASFDELNSSNLIEQIDAIFFHEPESGVVNGMELLYQTSITDGNNKYFIDIYDNKDGYSVGLNNNWETREDEQIIEDILVMLDNYPKKSKSNNSDNLSDDEVLKHFDEVLQKSKIDIPIEIKAGRYYISSEQFKLEHWGNDFLEINAYQEVDFTIEQLNQILSKIEIYNMDSSSPATSVVSSDVIINAEFIVDVTYDGYKIDITADDTSIYLRSKFYNNHYAIKIDNQKLYREYINSIDSNVKKFILEDISEIEYISLFYVKEHDKKDYPVNGRLSELKITDKKLISEIKDAIINNSMPTGTYQSREDADLILHTKNGDIYIKMKYLAEGGDLELEELMAEPTIIVEGYFWYECPELYNIMSEYLN